MFLCFVTMLLIPVSLLFIKEADSAAVPSTQGLLVGDKGQEIESHKDMPIFLEAIRKVETGGLPNSGIGAKGDNGKSLGPYQIQKAYWMDSMVKGGWEQCLNDKGYSEVVMLRYFNRYEPKALREGDWETLARLHNSGPKWRKKKEKTDAYWAKVTAYIPKPKK